MSDIKRRRRKSEDDADWEQKPKNMRKKGKESKWMHNSKSSAATGKTGDECGKTEDGSANSTVDTTKFADNSSKIEDTPVKSTDVHCNTQQKLATNSSMAGDANNERSTVETSVNTNMKRNTVEQVNMLTKMVSFHHKNELQVEHAKVMM